MTVAQRVAAAAKSRRRREKSLEEALTMFGVARCGVDLIGDHRR